MNSSFNPNPDQVTSFEYPVIPGKEAVPTARAWMQEDAPSEAQQSPDEIAAVARAEGRAEGSADAEARLSAAQQQQLAQLRQMIAQAVEEFAEERRLYFQRAESEVVRLSMAIARRILHRESQIDPMLLAGLVRSALEQLDSTSETVLHVHPSVAADWQHFFASQPGRERMPSVMADASVDRQSCLLESTVGTTEINIDSQLSEIERGFFDLLAGEASPKNSGAVQ